MRRRIALIGPFLPYRGGIAQHCTMLHRALIEKHHCLALSYSRQYPRWLFPGKSDIDESIADYREPHVAYEIDSINPFTWNKAVTDIVNFGAQLVIIPWWHVYWAPCFGWIVRALQKRGVEIVIFCHNALEHERASWKEALSSRVLRLADRFVVHTRSDGDYLKSKFPGKKITTHPHPVHSTFPDPTRTLVRRASLELLFFGFVRPYKGLDVLLDAMRLLRGRDVYLSVVGEFWSDVTPTKEFIRKHQLESQIELVTDYVSDSEAANYFNRADLVVLPYRSATGSAVIPVAYRYGKPVLATRVGGLPDVVIDGRTGFLTEPNSPRVLADAIDRTLQDPAQFSSEAISKLCASLTWPSLADAVMEEAVHAERE